MMKPDTTGQPGHAGRDTTTLQFVDLGQMAYEAALAEQRRIHEAVVNGDQPPTVLLVEHEPVITLGRRADAVANLRADEALLEQQGVSVCRTDRGGDVTYHGPGQLVAYPIIRLNDLGLNLRRYVWSLEQAIIETVVGFGVEAHRDACAVGVWVGGKRKKAANNDSAQCTESVRSHGNGEDCVYHDGAKLAAIGVRVRRWVSMHGLALNVDPNMRHFDLIVPCGLAGRPVTSLRQLLGENCPTITTVKQKLIHTLSYSLSASR
jgi:lipoate-protein ligase B